MNQKILKDWNWKPLHTPQKCHWRENEDKPLQFMGFSMANWHGDVNCIAIGAPESNAVVSRMGPQKSQKRFLVSRSCEWPYFMTHAIENYGKWFIYVYLFMNLVDVLNDVSCTYPFNTLQETTNICWLLVTRSRKRRMFFSFSSCCTKDDSMIYIPGSKWTSITEPTIMRHMRRPYHFLYHFCSHINHISDCESFRW